MDSLRLFLLDQGFPVECELDEFNTPHTGTTLHHPPKKLAMSTTMHKSAPTPSYFTSGQHFLETFTLLPETTRTTNSRWLQTFLSSNSKHDFCYTMANISLSHVQQHAQLSPLHKNFISFPYFFPSYETCSINVNPLFHVDIKNLHIKANGIFVFFILLYFATTLSEEITHTHTRKNTFLR